jgi:hypothetical protein
METRLNKFHLKLFGSLSHADAPTHTTSTSQLTFHLALQFTLHSGLILSWCIILHLPLLRYVAHSLTSSAITDKFWLRINQIYLKQAYLTLQISNVFRRNRKSPLWNVTVRVQNFAFHFT